MNQNLKGIIIDPGHGGIDSGAIGNNILEKEFNLLISNYMYERFKELGVPVYLTRDNDITINPQERTTKIKSFSGNNPNVILLSNHLNAGGGDSHCVTNILHLKPNYKFIKYLEKNLVFFYFHNKY